MTTPMSLQPWWWQIFILIQLWSQFFQMFVYGDVVYAQTWYWPWKTVSSHLHMPGRPMLLQYDPHFFSTLSKNLGNWRDFFGQMVYRPPLAKYFPYAYGLWLGCSWHCKILLFQFNSFEVGFLWSTRPVVRLVSISVSIMNRADPTMYEGQA